MQSIKKWLQFRREALRRSRWLGRGLFLFDAILLGIGYSTSPDFGLALGFLGVFLNHLLSPIMGIFIKELNAEIRPSGSLNIKVIPKQDNHM